MANHLCLICREPFEGPVNAKVCPKESCQRQYVKNYMRSYRRGVRAINCRMPGIEMEERDYLNSLKPDCQLFKPQTFQSLPVHRFAETVNRFLRMNMEDK